MFRNNHFNKYDTLINQHKQFLQKKQRQLEIESNIKKVSVNAEHENVKRVVEDRLEDVKNMKTEPEKVEKKIVNTLYTFEHLKNEFLKTDKKNKEKFIKKHRKYIKLLKPSERNNLIKIFAEMI